MTGKKVCVYIDADAAAAFETLTEIYAARGKSVSYCVSRAVEAFCKQAVSGVCVSEGAYACMMHGKLDKLKYLCLPGVDRVKDGYEHIVTCDDETYKCDQEVMADIAMIRESVRSPR